MQTKPTSIGPDQIGMKERKGIERKKKKEKKTSFTQIKSNQEIPTSGNHQPLASEYHEKKNSYIQMTLVHVQTTLG